MMTGYTITIHDVPRKKVLSVLESVPGSCKFQLDSDKGDQLIAPPLKSISRMAQDTTLTMTGKTAQKGSVREAILVTFEKLEKKHGIGNVTRRMLRQTTTADGIDSTVIGQLIAQGFLSPLKTPK